MYIRCSWSASDPPTIYDRNIWSDTFPTLEEAHTYATQCAVADVLYQPGGLTCLQHLKDNQK